MKQSNKLVVPSIKTQLNWPNNENQVECFDCWVLVSFCCAHKVRILAQLIRIIRQQFSLAAAEYPNSKDTIKVDMEDIKDMDHIRIPLPIN